MRLPFLLLVAALGPTSSAYALEASIGVELGTEKDQQADAEEQDAGYSPAHPLAVGVRSAVWLQRSLEPGLGGHLRWRPFSWVGVELSTDHFFSVNQAIARRDHMVGADLFLSFIGDDEFFVAPTAGVSLDVRVTEDAASDVTVQPLAGAHCGVMGELYLVDSLAAFAAAKAGALIGAAGEISLSEDAHVSGEVFIEPVGIITLGASYYF